MRRRKLWIVLVAVPLLVAAAGTLYWYVVVRNLDSGFAAWIAERRASGWTAAVGKPVRGGWPLAATLTVPDVLLTGGEPDIPGGLSWRTERLILRTDLLRPGVLDIAAVRLPRHPGPDRHDHARQRRGNGSLGQGQ